VTKLGAKVAEIQRLMELTLSLILVTNGEKVTKLGAKVAEIKGLMELTLSLFLVTNGEKVTKLWVQAEHHAAKATPQGEVIHTQLSRFIVQIACK